MATTVDSMLKQNCIDPLDAELLLGYVLQQPRSWLYGHRDEPVSAATAQRFAALVRQRQSGRPIAYLTGRREFWSLPLAVTDAVLIPRPDTELLVELALGQLTAGQPYRVADLGTGSGAIALAIASERPEATVLAVDCSDAALAVAAANAQQLAIANVRFIKSDWFAAIPQQQFDLIVANPPYLRCDDRHLISGDVAHEPRTALVSGADGLTDLRRIIATAPTYLGPGGRLIVEHGFDQQTEVEALFAAAGLHEVCGHRDLSNHPRCVSGRNRR